MTDTIFGSNTSTLPITGLQDGLSRKNYWGHSFRGRKMPLVEMIMGKETGDKALAMALDFTWRIKKARLW